MDRLLLTPRQALREHNERLQKAERARQAVQAYRRLRIRSRLRKAILDMVRLAVEFSGLVRNTERRLSGRPCC